MVDFIENGLELEEEVEQAKKVTRVFRVVADVMKFLDDHDLINLDYSVCFE